MSRQSPLGIHSVTLASCEFTAQIRCLANEQHGDLLWSPHNFLASSSLDTMSVIATQLEVKLVSQWVGVWRYSAFEKLFHL